jgi:hypothetical protein
MSVSPEVKRRLLIEFLSTEKKRGRIARSMQKPFRVRFEEALKLLQHWEDETEEQTAFMIAKEMLDNIFDCFEDYEFVREREEVVRMYPWGSSDLIDVDELLATFSWFVDEKKPTKVVKPTKTWTYSIPVQSTVEVVYKGDTHFGDRICEETAPPDLGLKVTWPERESSTPEREPQPELERKMKIGVDVASD